MDKRKDNQDVDIFMRLQRGMKNLTPQQRKMCSYINENYREAAFMTIEQISGVLKIGSATVLRTIHNLGYDSYKDFTAAVRHAVINQNSTYWREIRQSWKREGTNVFLDGLVEMTKQNITTLENSLSASVIESFDKAVVIMKKANKILILGLRSSRTASYYLFFMLHEFLPNVILADSVDSEDIYSNIVELGSDDVFIAFSLGGPNYVRQTHNAMKVASSKNIKIILITDSPTNPAVQYADIMICVSSPSSHYSMIPIMNILDAFIANMGSIHNEKRMNMLEQINKEYKIVF